jgi:hypothetical protein
MSRWHERDLEDVFCPAAQEVEAGRAALADVAVSDSVVEALSLRRKDFLNADLINEVLTTQVNQVSSFRGSSGSHRCH